MNWYLICIKNYFNFRGRARRREYWIFVLVNLTVIISLASLSYYVEYENVFASQVISTILLLYVLFIIIPHFAVVVRRLHDINKSGTWWFIRFVPLIGPFWLLYLLCEDSWEGPNKWDINPKGIGNDDIIDQIGDE